MKRFQIYSVLVLVAAAAPSRAGIIVDQPPLNTGGLGADTDFINDSGIESWQQVADDILLDAPATVRRVVWWGFYGGDFSGNPLPPEGPETMRIRFYDARPGDGLPGDRLFEESFLNPSRMETGRIVFSNGAPEHIYEVELTTPFDLAAGVPLWLEIVQVGDVDSTFRWEVSPGDETSFAFKNIFLPDWQLAGAVSNAAFQLSTIPEPTTLGMVLFGSFLVLGRRRSRKEL